MASKRKRSGPIFSSSNEAITTATIYAQRSEIPIGLPLFFPQSKPIDTTRLENSRDWKLQPEEEEESSHLNSRTRKRYRDNRPDEEQIHANTMHKLYDAQKTHYHHHHDHDYQQQQPIPSQHQQQPHHHQRQQKSTLHSFWHLPNTHRSSPQDSLLLHQHPPSPPQQQPQPSSSRYPTPTCEDCDRPLLPSDPTSTSMSMDLDMNISDIDETLLNEEVSCKSCGKLVCGFCAVVTDCRKCLECV